jgi:hypothetical protein
MKLPSSIPFVFQCANLLRSSQFPEERQQRLKRGLEKPATMFSSLQGYGSQGMVGHSPFMHKACNQQVVNFRNFFAQK